MNAPSPGRSASRAAAAIAVVAVCLAAALRLHALGGLSYFYDELYAVRIHGWSAQNLAGVIARSAFYDVHPPVYYVLSLVWSSLGGTGETWMRLASALLGIGTVALVYLTGRELGRRFAGALGALVLAVSPFHVYYSREARMYALLAFLASLSLLLMARLARATTDRWTLPAYLAATTLLMWTHYFGVFIVAGQIALLLARGRAGAPTLGGWVAVLGVPIASFLPWAVFARYQSRYLDAAYLGSGFDAYAQVGKWLLGGHGRLSAAWALPVLALCAWGVARHGRAARAAAACDAPAMGGPWGAATTAAGRNVVAWVLCGVGVAAALAFVALHDSIAAILVRVQEGRGEVAAVAQPQGQAVAAAAVAGGLGLAAAGALYALRGRLSALLLRFAAATPGAPPRGDPLRSVVALPAGVLAVTIAISLVAGALGRPLVQPRNFVALVPPVALLAGFGLSVLPRSLRVVAIALLLACGTWVTARFTPLPGLAPSGGARPWLMHGHHEWRDLVKSIPGGGRPVLTVRHPQTDAIGHYLPDHAVARVASGGPDGWLAVTQVLNPAAWPGGGPPPSGPPSLTSFGRFYWIDCDLHDYGNAAPRERLRALVDAEAWCEQHARIDGDVVVYACSARPPS